MIENWFMALKRRIREFILNKKIRKRTVRLVENVSEISSSECRILYDLTLSHHWMRDGIMVGIVRVCTELYIALRKIAPIEIVQIKNLGGKPEIHRVNASTLRATDEIILPRKGDIILTPELQIRGVHVPVNHPELGYLHKYGVKTCAIIHDILPLYYPQYFEKSTAKGMLDYLINIRKNYDIILCVSKSVCDTVYDYLKKNTIPPLSYTMVCNASGNGFAYMTSGWYGAEPEFTWSNGNSVISFYCASPNEDLCLRVECFTFSGSGKTRVFLNNHNIGTVDCSINCCEYKFVLPKEYLQKLGVQNIHFLTEDAHSPYETGLSDDERVLGIGVHRIVIEAENKKEIAISEELSNYPLRMGYYHNGVTPLKKDGLLSRVAPGLKRFIRSHRMEGVFLMVGTVEPRKGHEFVIKAFEKIWGRGEQCGLCIIGRIGWNMEDFMISLKNHPMLGKNLLFLENASDSTLSYAYKHSTALIQASIDEGFGLPLVEAGAYGIPVICNDIPVFHEVAGENAIYFSRSSIEKFIECYDKFHSLKNNNQLPNSQSITGNNWDEAAKEVFSQITEKQPLFFDEVKL